MLLPLLLLTVAVQDQPATTVPPASPRLLEAAAAVAALPNTTVHGYEIEGRTRARIRSAINAGRPASPDGERHDGVTTWRYSHRGRNGPNGCMPGEIEVGIQAIVILPDLATKDQLNSRDRAAWDAYFQSLVAHEMNHVRIAQAGATVLQNAMRAAPTCEAAIAAGMAVNDEVAAASREYDRRTEHGAREGARF